MNLPRLWSCTMNRRNRVRDTKRLSAFCLLITTFWSWPGQPGELPSSLDAPLFTLEAKIPLGALTGRIDHMALDMQRRRLFVAELGNDTVGVVSLLERKVITGSTGSKNRREWVTSLPSICCTSQMPVMGP